MVTVSGAEMINSVPSGAVYFAVMVTSPSLMPVAVPLATVAIVSSLLVQLVVVTVDSCGWPFSIVVKVSVKLRVLPMMTLAFSAGEIARE